MTLTNEYTFERGIGQEKVKALAKSYKWFGEIKVDGHTLRSERPMPPRLYEMLERLSEIKTTSLDLYQDCRRVYTQVLNEGEKTFPDAYDVILKYGFAANCVLAEMIDMKEATKRLGRKTTEKFLNLAVGMSIQPRLFD